MPIWTVMNVLSMSLRIILLNNSLLKCRLAADSVMLNGVKEALQKIEILEEEV